MAESDLSSEVNATTLLPAPTIGDPSVDSDGNAVISWTNNDDSSDGGIDVERTTGSFSFPDDPVYYQALDADGTAEVGSFDLTVSGATPTTGIKGGSDEAFDFDGDDVLKNESVGGMGVANGGLTISIWKNGRNEPQKTVEFRGERVKRNFSTHCPWSDGNVYWDVGSDGGNFGRISGNLPSEYYSGWHHFVFWYDPSISEARVYVDGSKLISGTVNKSINTIKKLYIGAQDGTNYVDGKLDEFRVYDRPLTKNEIDALYQSPIAQPTTVASDLSPSTTSYTDTSVSSGETYEYRIERNTDHATAASNSKTVAVRVSIAEARIDKAGTTLKVPIYNQSDVSDDWFRVRVNGTVGVFRPVDKNGEPLRARSPSGTIVGIETRQL